MDAGLVVQYVVVSLAVVGSVAYVVLTRFPATVRRLRGWLALRLVDSGSAPLAALGRRLAPSPRAQDGCSACGGCGPD